MSFKDEKKALITWARRLNERGLVSAKNGNVSCRVASDKVLITGHDAYLGYLEEDDLLLVDRAGTILEGSAEMTTEKDLHLGIYRKFNDAQVVLHAHSPYTTAFFYYHDQLDLFAFETKFYLGNLKAIPQETPAVTDLAPVIDALEKSTIVILKQHGVVAMGASFKDAFSLVELLEEQAKVNLMVNASSRGPQRIEQGRPKAGTSGKKRYKMLSKEHGARLMEVMNSNAQIQELGKKYDLTCTLAVKNQDTAEVMCFYYEQGRISAIDNNEDAEFVIIGNGAILKKVFNREIDPFVASTQGKVKTKGDFAKMSKWYPVLVKIFQLWEEAPVE